MNNLLKFVALLALLTVIGAGGLIIRRELAGTTESASRSVAAASEDAAEAGAENTTAHAKVESTSPSTVPVAAAQPTAGYGPSRTSRSLDEVRTYLRKSQSAFPVSVVDRIFFFTPMTLNARTVLNHVQIDFTQKDLATISKKVLVEFLVHAVNITQLFNCENHRELLDKNVALLNVLSTREPDARDRQLPAVIWNGYEIKASEGFVTTRSTCESLPPRPDLKPKSFSSAEDRLLSFFSKHRPPGNGTGWPLRNGLIVTNNHVADGTRRVYVVRNDREFREARVLITDPVRDLAILHVDDPEFLPAGFELAEEDRDIGERVFTIGYPWTAALMNALPQPQLTQGIISSLPESGIEYQLSMPVHGGNSGGPLIGMDGKVVGVVASKLVRGPGEDRPENVSMAIRVEHLRHMLELLRKDEVIAPAKFPTGSTEVAALAPTARESVLLILVM